MTTVLKFDGVNDIVSIPTPITGNAGTGNYTFRVRSGPSGITLPATGVAGFLGTSQATGSNGFATNPSGQLRVYRSGTNLYGSTTQLIFSGVPFDYTLTHLANGSWDIYDNLTATPTGQAGTYTQTQSWSNGTNGLNQLGRSSSTNTVYLNGYIELIKVTGLTNSEEWNANLSGGTGSVLPTTSGNNNGALVNFPTDGSQWETTGASPVTATIEGGLPVPVAASNLTIATSALTASILAGIPSLTAAAVMRFPLSTLSINTGLPVPTANVVTQGGVSVSTDNSYQNRKLQLIAEARAAFPTLPINSAILEFLKLRYSENSNINVLILRFLREA